MLSNTTKLKGLYTFGNELLHPEGSLDVADNINIDEPSVITQRRGFTDYADQIDPSSTRVRQLLSYKSTLFRYYGSSLEYYKNGVFQPFDGSYYELDKDIRIKSVLTNGNLLFTTSQGIKKISALTAKDFSSAPNYITNAGIPEALDIFGKVSYTTTGFLPPESKVAYKVLFGKKDINNNLLLGSPSSRFIVSNTSKDVYTYEKTNLVFKTSEDFKTHDTTVNCGSKNNTAETNGSNPNSVLLVHSANDTYKYAFYFQKGGAIPPSIAGYTNVAVNLVPLAGTDNVAPAVLLAAQSVPLEDIEVIQVGGSVYFNNTIEGTSSGINTPTGSMAAIGAGWTKNITKTGTNSKYIERFFTVPTVDQTTCFYYGNDRTISNIPTDPSTIGMNFVGILIQNDSSKQFIANKTSQVVRSALADYFKVTLDTSFANPIMTMTDITGGDLEDIKQGDLNPANLEVIVLNQGTISEGQFANVDLKFTIPTGVDTSYFYRIYRTSTVTVSKGITMNDIDPGEEHNLVYEGSVSSPSGTQLNVTDITNETFRNAGEPLYNNPISGEGILQSNYIPPVAKDLTLYRGYTFYGNTKINHQQNITTVTVDDIVSSTSKFNIISGSTLRSYLFRGSSSNFTLTAGTRAGTKIHKLANPDSKIYLYSALNVTKYIIYFADGTDTPPTDTDAVQIRVDISDLAPSDPVAPSLLLTLNQFADFSVTRVGNDVTIENAENGLSTTMTTPNSNIVTDIGTGYDITVNQIGEGEDTSSGIALISKSASVGLKLERTIRSLVNVINADTLSPVNAYYISSLTDLPGKFLLKARSIEDQSFYSFTEDFSGADFNPEIPTKSTASFTNITPIGTTITELELVAHEFVNDEEVFIIAPNAVPAIQGSYTVTVVDANNIRISQKTLGGTATGSYYFFPFEKSDNLSSPNRVMYSKFSQPEAVPIINYIDIGTKDEPIERILSLRDYLFVLKTDGIYMLSGDGGQFTVRMIDTEKILCPDSAVVLNNQIFMLATSGIVAINENSPVIVSRMIENKFQSLGKFKGNVRRQGFGVAYEDDRAYLLWIPTDNADEVPTQAFRYNILEKMWTRWTKTATCGLILDSSKETLMYIGDGDRSIIMEERKKLDRTDFADKNFTVEIGISAFISGKFRISSLTDVQAGDVIIQEQRVNVSEYGRFLRKLDLDTGILYNTFSTDFEVKVGDNLSTLLTSVNAILVGLDTSSTITVKSFNNLDWEQMQESYNLLIDELNNSACVSIFKNYKESKGIIEYEHIIKDTFPSTNEISVWDETEFIQGNLVIYKHIKSSVQTNPIHFGNPSSFKQIPKGFLLFDQNNFFRMRLEYSTDLSKGFEGHDFRGRGAGFWGSSTWGFEDRNYWGGEGNDAPRRVIVPRNKQRCRYITVKFTHAIARDTYRVVGVAHDVREFSTRAYR